MIVSDVLDYQDVSSLIDFSPWQINAIAFASDSKRLFTGSNLFRLWDVDRRTAKFTVQRGIVASVAVHPNDQEFVGANEDGRVTIFDKAGTELASRQKRGFPLAVKYIDDGKRLLIAGWE